MTETKPFHITIARQLASGGSDLGQRIARRLGFAYIDRQILKCAAEELGMTEAELSHREESIQSFWVRLMEVFSTTCAEYTLSTPPLRIISDDRLIEAEQRVLLRLVSRGSCVIVGRCGFHVLKEKSRLLNVFVHAPKIFRIERMIKFYGAHDESQAREMIKRTDYDRECYTEKLTERSWYDARNYHMAFDMSQVGFEAAEDMIVSVANRMMPEKEI
jgi:CMP/dCMP kinase